MGLAEKHGLTRAKTLTRLSMQCHSRSLLVAKLTVLTRTPVMVTIVAGGRATISTELILALQWPRHTRISIIPELVQMVLFLQSRRTTIKFTINSLRKALTEPNSPPGHTLELHST